jgi:hypothetical protein
MRRGTHWPTEYAKHFPMLLSPYLLALIVPRQKLSTLPRTRIRLPREENGVRSRIFELDECMEYGSTTYSSLGNRIRVRGTHWPTEYAKHFPMLLSPYLLALIVAEMAWESASSLRRLIVLRYAGFGWCPE